VVAALACSCTDAGRCGPSSGVVERVVDGDTIVLAGGQKIRYLDVDTPESTASVECFGPEAAAWNEARVVGREVQLTYDEQCTDRYGRLLAHVWVDGTDVGLEEVQQGYGCALIIAPNVDGRQAFEDAQQVARVTPLGLWAECETPWPCGD